MTPYEIMLSESQERMLIIVQKGREEEVKRISTSGTAWAEIGSVTDTGTWWPGSGHEIFPPARSPTNRPVYEREAREPRTSRPFARSSSRIPGAAEPIPTAISKNC